MVSQFINRLVKGKSVALGEELFDALSYFERNPAKAIKLVERGADVNLRDEFGCTALHRTVSRDEDFLPFAELLLKRGADANARDNNGHTPLSYCLRNDDPRMAELLIKYGARAALVDKSEKSGRFSKHDNLHDMLDDARRDEINRSVTVRSHTEVKAPKLKFPKR